jgi:hypothetical protein
MPNKMGPARPASRGELKKISFLSLWQINVARPAALYDAARFAGKRRSAALPAPLLNFCYS